MSVSGRSTALFDAEISLDEEALSEFARLPRNTLSAIPAHRHARGLQAVLVSFDRKVQQAIRRLCFERISIEARLRAERERLAAIEQRLMRDPDVLERLVVALKDNEYNIRRLAGDATPHIIAALHDPVIQDGLQLAVPTEDDTATETEARVWRRKLQSIPLPVRLTQPYRYTTHDSPTNKGAKDLHNELSKRTGEEGLSYYQKQQLRYGRGRRGSTSIAGAWEDVFSKTGEVMPSATLAEQGADLTSSGSAGAGFLGRTSNSARSASPPRAPHSRSVSPSRARQLSAYAGTGVPDASAAAIAAVSSGSPTSAYAALAAQLRSQSIAPAPAASASSAAPSTAPAVDMSAYLQGRARAAMAAATPAAPTVAAAAPAPAPATNAAAANTELNALLARARALLQESAGIS